MKTIAHIQNRGMLCTVLASALLVTGCQVEEPKQAPGDPVSTPTPAPPPPPPPASPAPPPPPASPVPSAPAGHYDTSIGNGVDVNGFAHLPLRSGAKRYWVDSARGSDNNSCSAAERPTAPKATIASAANCIVNGALAGDQIMIAEGTTYSGGFPNMSKKLGHSAIYPTVIQTYDPADPNNEASHGRALGNRRAVVNSPGLNHWTIGNDKPMSYFAVRGIEWNSGDRGSIAITGGINYLLIENTILRNTQISFGGGPAQNKHIFRHMSFDGSWSGTGHAQAIYDENVENITVEDSIFYHNGWKKGGGRDATREAGGPTMFNHAIYFQGDTSATIRRSVFVDPSATGIMSRGPSRIVDNVHFDNPIAIGAGGGTDYHIYRPKGVMLEIANNLVVGDADISPGNPRGQGIATMNGIPGSYARNNLIVHSRNVDAVNVVSFQNGAHFDQPSHMKFERNVAYRFSTETIRDHGSRFPARVFSVYEHNIWDAPVLGSNLNSAQHSFPNPVTAANIYAHLGCSNKQGCVNAMIANPNQPWAKRIRSYTFPAYGLTP